MDARALTEDELATLRHGVSSLDVRARGRLSLVRVACPPDVDPARAAAALREALHDTPLGGVDVVVHGDAGEVRVLGGLFG